MQNVGDKISGAGTKMLLFTGVVAVAGVAAVKTAADFDSGMSFQSASRVNSQITSRYTRIKIAR